jgi:hypothetical protein
LITGANARTLRIGSRMLKSRVPGNDPSSPQPNNMPGTSLGDFFSELPFADQERTRIASQLGKESTPGRIVRAYVTRTDGYRNGFLKHERIAGALPDSALYKRQAVERIIKALGDPAHHRYKICWELYKDAAIAFIKKELPALDRLLKEVPTPEEASTAVEMLKAVCAHGAEYAVTPEHVTTFYDVWGIPRIENLGAVLPEWFRADEHNAQKRQINRLLTEVGKLTNALQELAGTVGSIEEGVTRDREASERTRGQVDVFKLQLQALSEGVSQATAHSVKEDALKRIDERVTGLAEKVSKLTEKLAVPREDISSRDLHRLASEIRANTTESINGAVDAVAKKLREELSASATDLDSRIMAVSSEVSRRRDPSPGVGLPSGSTGSYRSPLIGASSPAQGTYKLATELDFVNTWLHHLSQAYDIVLMFEQAVALHRAFLGTPVVVCDRIFALSWIHCLSWQPFTMHLAASPTWSAEEDWAPGAEHLFRREVGGKPQFVVIHNYDVGLADCYLVPSLVLWGLRRDAGALSKLFLLPSAHDHVPTRQILEHAPCFANNTYITTRPLQLKDGIRFPQPLYRDPPMGAEPKVVAQWSSQNPRIAFPSIQRALKCRLPYDLVASFERMAASMARYVDDSASIAVAMHHQVVPWVQVAHGEAKAAELSSLLSTVAGGRD